MTAALELIDLKAWYGQTAVLHGIDLRVDRGEVVALIGPGGCGRTSVLRAVLGLTHTRSGSIRIDGAQTIDLPPRRISELGVGYCRFRNSIFGNLSCEENLLLPPPAGGALGGGMSLSDIYAHFTCLEERRHVAASRLSPDHQQLLAMGRILRTGANLLLLDDVAKGVAQSVAEALCSMIRTLKARGYTIVLAEAARNFCEGLADRFYAMDQGRIVHTADASAAAAIAAERVTAGQDSA